MKPMLSIIIVNYHVKEELLRCLQSILSSKTKTSYEIIVVDNDETKYIQPELKKKFPQVVYIPNVNKGFGQGNNVGAKHATGDYLFFLNPDTEISPRSVDALIAFLKKDKQIGIVAPLLLGKDKKPYQQGTLELNPLRGMVALSILNKIFPNNPVSKKYFLNDWDRKSVKEVGVVPGTALMMKKSLFEKVGGFDETFFLYFEEFDLCKRIKALGLRLYIIPEARAFHHWGASTKTRTDINKIFLKSRFYYFKKHFGLIAALLTEAVMRIGKYSLLLLLIAMIGLLLRMFKIEQTMPFIGDQGWFYLSARDMIQTGSIPLIGIASSHPWLHQGALWTYLLGPWLWLFYFNPVSGAYLSIIIDILALFVIYCVGSKLFTQRVGLLSAALYATAPLVILNARMPYHTSPIPLFTALFIFALYQWITGNKYYFPLVIMILAILYNLELATFVLSFLTVGILLYGILKKQSWAREVLQMKIVCLSIAGLLIPLAPMILYDLSHGFPQTVGFMAWIGYKVLVLFGLPPLTQTTSVSWSTMGSFAVEKFTTLIFAYSNVVSAIIFICSVGYLTTLVVLKFKRKKLTVNFLLLLLVISVSLGGFFVAKTPSEAYLPMLFPSLIILTALFFDALLTNKTFKIHAVILLGIILLANSYYILSMINSQPEGYMQRIAVAKQIVAQAKGGNYTIRGEGPGSEFPSFVMNYQYLTWWLGHEPSSTKQKREFIITETKNNITVKEKAARR